MNTVSRREVLAAFLGLPVALAACRSTKAPQFPAGEIVGASDSIGHRLRDGLNIKPAADNWQQAGVVIVGGGVAGLSGAWRFLTSCFACDYLLELEAATEGA